MTLWWSVFKKVKARSVLQTIHIILNIHKMEELNPKKSSYIINITGWAALGAAWSIITVQHPVFVANQNTKFLHAAAKTGFGHLDRDWMSGTIDPLPAFTLLIESLYRLGSLELVYLIFPALLAIMLWSMNSIANRLFGISKNSAATAVFLALLFIEHENLQNGLANQYLIGNYLQPCVFGVFIILAIERFMAESRLSPPIYLAIAAAIHPTYMPAALLIQGSFTAISIYRNKRITSEAILPLLLFIALSAPLVIRYKLLFSYTTPRLGAEAMEILANRRISWHAKVNDWINFSTYVNILLILTSMIIIRKSPLFWIMAPLAAVIVVTVPLLYFISWPALEVLTPWRTSVILVPLTYTILAGKLASSLLPVIEKNRTVQTILFIGGCLAIALLTIRHVPGQVKLFMNAEQTPESAVIDFARHHANDKDIWIVPPSNVLFDPFRLETGMPILVNWKTHPYKDREIIEWYQRNKEVENFYNEANTPKGRVLLCQLAAKYGITKVVVNANTPMAFYNGMSVCWQNDNYKVIGIEGCQTISGKNPIHRNNRQWPLP
jgi:hypothetical protein